MQEEDEDDISDNLESYCPTGIVPSKYGLKLAKRLLGKKW